MNKEELRQKAIELAKYALAGAIDGAYLSDDLTYMDDTNYSESEEDAIVNMALDFMKTAKMDFTINFEE